MSESKYPYRTKIFVSHLTEDQNFDIEDTASRYIKTKKRYTSPATRAMELSRWLYLRASDHAKDSTTIETMPGSSDRIQLKQDPYWALAFCAAHNKVLDQAENPTADVHVICGTIAILIRTEYRPEVKPDAKA